MAASIKKLLPTFFIVASTFAHGEPDPAFCQMNASLAQSIAEDRDKGVHIKAELGKLKGATEGLPSRPDLEKMARSQVQTIYVDMPRLTPVGAYKLFYVACMSQK
jgi:hypothetical protein